MSLALAGRFFTTVLPGKSKFSLLIYFIHSRVYGVGLPGWLSDNQPVMQEPQETKIQSLDQEASLKEGMATHSNILAWRIPMDRGAWQAMVHRVAKSQT